MSKDMTPIEAERAGRTQGVGCASAFAIVNLVLMGFVAAGFATGPYSSSEQMRWYRLGSMAFLLFGEILPAAALFLAARRFPVVTRIAMVWMSVALILFLRYLFYSSGGV